MLASLLASLPAALPVVLSAPAPACADTMLPATRTLLVSARIVPGCGVAGGGAGTGLALGTLDFGTYPAVASGQAGAALAGALQIECAGATALRMTVDGGLHPSGGQRHLRGAAGTLVAYRLYADAGRTRPIAIGQAVSVMVPGVASLPLHGELTLPGGRAPPGAYTDTAQVTLTY
ncbi:spore coat protein U domain-containing protein [Cupriavidus sp. 30B13]|uniref:spore coat protein U domain-containing protein n=1 Tax=Cupriavidus sp. 30B13 TaxID=3384241 RepID=UPI003B905707